MTIKLALKWPLFTKPGFYLAAVACFGVWALLTSQLRSWSLKQDEDGAAQCTYRIDSTRPGGYGFSAHAHPRGDLWMKALQHQWFSTMYGVYYFAGSAWVASPRVHHRLVLDRQGLIRDTMGAEQYYFLGSLLFAFTVFSAYIHFAQSFVIWNANMPEETFW